MPHTSTRPDSAVTRIMSGAVPEGAVDLSIGEPDQPLPAVLVSRAVDSLHDGRTGYTPKLGLQRLRELIAADTAAPVGERVATEDVIVTVGGTGAVATAMIVAGRDGIVVPDPAWPNYRVLAGQLGIHVHSYDQGPSGDGFADLDAIERALVAGARLVVVNSPSNPTGAVASARALTELVELVRRHDALLLSDEAYESIVFSGSRAPSPIEVGGGDVTFAARTFSKRFSMTGLRAGSLISPARFRNEVAAVHGTTAGCAPITAQLIGIAALESIPERGIELSAAYAARYRLAATVLGDRLVPVNDALLGGFYLWIDARDTGRGSAELAGAIAAQGVYVSDGTVYSRHDGFLRAALTADDSRLPGALKTIARELRS